MALADYYNRIATAVAHNAAHFDEGMFKEKLNGAAVGIGFAKQAASSVEGRALLDMVIRLTARLYPKLSLKAGMGADTLAGELASLARAINPCIEIHQDDVELEIAVGRDAPIFAPVVFFAGSRGWDAYVSTASPQAVGASRNPFGAAAAACFACANVFRAVFVDHANDLVDTDLCFSVLDRDAAPSRRNLSLRRMDVGAGVAIVGLGAIGNAATWALAQAPLAGNIILVDHQDVDLSNLQRYVLTKRTDEHRLKVDVASEFFTGDLMAIRHDCRWGEFLESQGYCWSRVLVALDSARDRRAVQASLPEWIANAWTQPGDLGVSVHPTFVGTGACLNCLYLPQHALGNEDAIVANALGVPERLAQIRDLLYRQVGVSRELLEVIASRLDVPLEKLLDFEGRPVRTLYVDGVCGGAVLPLGRTGAPRQDVHVPLAHQSALAGVLLAGALVADLLGTSPRTTMITRIDLMRSVGHHLSQPAGKDGRGICICQDRDYMRAYRRKYPAAVGLPEEAAEPPIATGVL